MPLKVFLSIFVAIVVLRTWTRRRRGDLSSREATAWTVLWLLVFAAVLNPHATDVVARWFGVGRGADLLIFISIVALFALVSWLLARVEKIEREITAVVRETALRDLVGARSKESTFAPASGAPSDAQALEGKSADKQGARDQRLG